MIYFHIFFDTSYRTFIDSYTLKIETFGYLCSTICACLKLYLSGLSLFTPLTEWFKSPYAKIQNSFQ